MFVLWLLVLTILVVLVYLAPAIRQFKKHYDFAQSVPGPSFAEIHEVSKSGSLFDMLTECRLKYGPVVRLWLGLDLTVIFFDADDIKEIATSPKMIDKAKGYYLGRDWVGDGLLTNSGDHWRQKRKLLTPAFNIQVLSSFREPIEKCLSVLVKRLDEFADGRPIDIQEYPHLFSMDVICETAMGTQVNAQLNEGSVYVKANKLMSTLMYRQMFSIWKRIPFLYQFSPDYKQRKHALSVMQGETRRVIKMRRSQFDLETVSNSNDGTKEESVYGEKRRVAFLDFLLKSQRETGLLTDQNIQEEVDTFMFGGQDTTGTAIAFCIYSLANHPEVQRLAFEDVEHIQEFNANLSLPYLDAVIRETLRIYPSIPSFSRRTNEPTKIGKYLLPAGITVNIPAYHVHREAKYFPDPECFRPERFLHVESTDTVHPYANVTFGAGVRNCIGQRFAMLEIKLALTRLLQAFSFSAVDGFRPHIVADLTMKSGNGLWVKLHKRRL